MLTRSNSGAQEPVSEQTQVPVGPQEDSHADLEGRLDLAKWMWGENLLGRGPVAAEGSESG